MGGVKVARVPPNIRTGFSLPKNKILMTTLTNSNMQCTTPNLTVDKKHVLPEHKSPYLFIPTGSILISQLSTPSLQSLAAVISKNKLLNYSTKKPDTPEGDILGNPGPGQIHCIRARGS